MALFSKHHYDWLAVRQRHLIEGAFYTKYAYINATYQLAAELKKDNQDFDVQKFLKASGCGEHPW